MNTHELGVEDYEIEAWILALGSVPKARVAHENFSKPYETCLAHVFKLENGKYALVTEEGCSCYKSSDANIDIFPNESCAIEAFGKWVKENKEPNHD